MARGRKRAISPSDSTEFRNFNRDCADQRTIREARARIRARDLSQTRRDNIRQSNSSDSPLLRLPAELRNMIFGWVFRGTEYSIYEGYWKDENQFLMHDCGICEVPPFNYPASFDDSPLNVLLVCRQLHTECCLLPYNLGSFYFRIYQFCYAQQLLALDKFLKFRTEEQIEAIPQLDFDERENQAYFKRDSYARRYSTKERSIASPRTSGAFWVAKLAEDKYQADIEELLDSFECYNHQTVESCINDGFLGR